MQGWFTWNRHLRRKGEREMRHARAYRYARWRSNSMQRNVTDSNYHRHGGGDIWSFPRRHRNDQEVFVVGGPGEDNYYHRHHQSTPFMHHHHRCRPWCVHSLSLSVISLTIFQVSWGSSSTLGIHYSPGSFVRERKTYEGKGGKRETQVKAPPPPPARG